MKIELSKVEERAAIVSIQQYLMEEYELESSELKSKLLLKFFMKELGPFAYNKGVGDAEAFMRGRLEDLAGSCFEQPLDYRGR